MWLCGCVASAFLPFEDNGERTVMVNSGSLHDMIAPNSVNIYRIGCTLPPPDKHNFSPNGDFEMHGLLGGVTGWSGGRAGWYSSDGHDLRARMFLDTTRPQHGRYALRITVPTAAPLTTGWAQVTTCTSTVPFVLPVFARTFVARLLI